MKDVAENLRIRSKKEREEKKLKRKEEQEEKKQKRKEKAEARFYAIIKVARDENLHEQIGKNRIFDLVDHEKVRSFRIRKQTSFALFKEEVAKELGIPVQCQRFWLWGRRRDYTYSPYRPLTPLEEAQPVGRRLGINNDIKLFLEVELGQDSQLVPPPAKTKEEILLFFKLYNPIKEELRELLGYINLYHCFKQIKFEPNVMCERVDKKLTFQASRLGDGCIIYLQKPLQPGTVKCRYPNVSAFLEYVPTLFLRFRSLEKPMEDEFLLELSKLNNYDDVVERVAAHLSLDDPSKIRLTSHDCYSQQPNPQPIKYRGVEHLSDMLLGHYNLTSDILYNEVLDIPLPELECQKTLKVAFHHTTKDEVVTHIIRSTKQSTVADVINDLKTKVQLSHKDVELRLVEVFYHKIYKIFQLNEKIENITDQYWTIRAEEIPEEQKDLGPQDRLIHVYHFTKDASQNHVEIQNFGEPFLFVIRDDETLAEIKLRIQNKLHVPNEEFSKWKFAFVYLGNPRYLQDSDVVSTIFKKIGVYGDWEQYLGLEHSDNAYKRSYDDNGCSHPLKKRVHSRLVTSKAIYVAIAVPGVDFRNGSLVISIVILSQSKTFAHKPKEKITNESSKKAKTSTSKSNVVKAQPQPPPVKQKPQPRVVVKSLPQPPPVKQKPQPRVVVKQKPKSKLVVKRFRSEDDNKEDESKNESEGGESEEDSDKESESKDESEEDESDDGEDDKESESKDESEGAVSESDSDSKEKRAKKQKRVPTTNKRKRVSDHDSLAEEEKVSKPKKSLKKAIVEVKSENVLKPKERAVKAQEKVFKPKKVLKPKKECVVKIEEKAIVEVKSENVLKPKERAVKAQEKVFKPKKVLKPKKECVVKIEEKVSKKLKSEPNEKKKKPLTPTQIKKDEYLSKFPTLLSRTVTPSLFSTIRDARVDMQSFLEDIGFSSLHGVNIEKLPSHMAGFVVANFNTETYELSLEKGKILVTPEKIHEILGVPLGGTSFFELPERSIEDPFVQLWLKQFYPKKYNKIRASDVAGKLITATQVDFMFKVNFLTLFANVMAKAHTMKALVDLTIVRRISENTIIANIDYEIPNKPSGFYNGALCFLILLYFDSTKFEGFPIIRYRPAI
ncbi:ubiquitin-specific protease 13 [Artemisia annua]|uniref:ubiquitinyl hydrolase 1 n=1 Tax=Artemisia annua TaxID=35608 RepID=A0A2U1M8V6_ARTAN|nr:ubiquitin-specific protease 13 [Artemisia annua]